LLDAYRIIDVWRITLRVCTLHRLFCLRFYGNCPYAAGVSTGGMTMTRNQWTWLLVAATILLALGVLANLFWFGRNP
jgi:hypothetical protein